MRAIFFCFGFVVFSVCSLQAQLPPIGYWREHLDYRPAIQVLKGDKIYCATTAALFSVDDEEEIRRYSKVTGLTDIGIRCIGWDTTTAQLVVAYNNNNLDILRKEFVTNIGDIKRSPISGNKTIYNIYCRNGLAYLCSGLGVIVTNLTKYEIKDTWLIGNNGGQVKVNGLCTDVSFYYAATEEGLKRASLNADPSDYHNWTIVSGNNGLPSGAFTNVISTNNQVFAQKKDSVFVLSGNTWNLWYTDPAWSVISANATVNKVLLCQQSNTGNARVIQLSLTGSIEKTFSQQGFISRPLSAITESGKVWVADSTNGLAGFTSSGAVQFIPNGPPGISTGEMISDGEQLYVAAGSVNNTWQPLRNRNGISQFSGNEWHSSRYDNTPALNNIFDFVSLAVDPVDKSLWAGSYGGGLVRFRNNTVNVYRNGNSALQAALSDPGSYRVSGLAFDQNNNLWMSNYGAAQDLVVRKADSSWKAFTIPFPHTENAVSQVLVDDANQLWITSPKGNGLFCYNYGAGIDNTGDDKWKNYLQGSGLGNLPSNTVLCMLKDKNGFIWIGTDKGIGIIRCTGNVFTPQGCDALLPVVQQDRFAGLLFRDETVQAMAADGADRKWVGTKNGLWLLSPDGSSIVYRFTSDNSPLLSNDVKKITVDPVTGEVFIATANGICSFRSTATEGSLNNNAVLVFPNPVPPGYNGTIAVRGLVNNALVKIAEMNGRLVYQARALGGQMTWDGRDYLGNKVASGIYLVIVRNDVGDEKIVTKIAITSGR